VVSVTRADFHKLVMSGYSQVSVADKLNLYREAAEGMDRLMVHIASVDAETPENQGCLAEAVRFELTEGINPRRFSRPVP
jgi:hypothetical protein